MIDDVETLLDKHGITYKINGANLTCKCLNPWHNDSNPSMSIRISDGVFRCWSCGYSGNIYTLNRVLGEDMDEKERLSSLFSLSLKNDHDTHRTVEYPSPIVYGKLADVSSSVRCKALADRIGFSQKFIDAFNVRYSQYTEMISENHADLPYTQMQERIVIPITLNGRLINYECRTIENEKPKVKYVRGCSTQTVFNIDIVNPDETLVVTESIKNLARIWNVFPNVVSIFHNILTDVQAEMLVKFKDMILFLDNDEGGLGKYENGKCTRDGMLQSFLRKMNRSVRICFDRRTYVDENGKKCGYDANDCTEDEIIRHIENAVDYETLKNRIISANALFKKKIIW